MDQKQIVLFTAIGIVILMFFMAAGNITGAAVNQMPAEQCYKLATNLDRTVAKKVDYLYMSGTTYKNPCTGQPDTYDMYFSSTQGTVHIRTIYGNGDRRGWNGWTEYVLCTDGRAEIVGLQPSFYAMSKGWAVGHWYKRIKDYNIEKCSTL